MKDVYVKNPQMGDPASVDPRLSEIGQNIEKLQFEVQKFEVSPVPVLSSHFSVSVSVGEAFLFGLSETLNNEEFKHTSPSWGGSKEVCCSSILGEDVMQLEGLATCWSSAQGERSPRTMA